MSFLEEMFIKLVRSRKTNNIHYGYEWCGNRTRWGTSQKLRAINNRIKDLTKQGYNIYQYIGIAYDEPKRLERLDKNKIAPLAEWKMSELDCLQYCYDKGYNWNEYGVELYEILDRVSCWCCSNKNLKELKNIYTYLPNYWKKLKGIQSRTIRPMKGEGKSVFDLEERFKKEKK